jgi:hypothetical protein
MEHPMFALAKNPGRVFKNREIWYIVSQYHEEAI